MDFIHPKDVNPKLFSEQTETQRALYKNYSVTPSLFLRKQSQF